MSRKEKNMDAMNQPAQAAPAGTPSEQLVKYLCDNVARSATWMKLLGVLLIIDGIIMLISVIGIIFCWLPIWLGVIIFKAAGDAETANKGVPQQLGEYVQKINRFFLIAGILALIYLIIVLIFFFVFGMAAIWSSLGFIS
jgi:uncharacterized membrane protein